MKKFLTVLFLIAVLTSFGSFAEAVTWSYDFESFDESPDVWEPGLPTIETGAEEYDYEWEMTEAFIQIEPQGQPVWVPILDVLPPEDKGGAGTVPGLPFQIGPILIEEPGITASIFLGVLDTGEATGLLTGVTFGSVDGTNDVTGVRFAGNFTVTPVPEPATIGLLSVAALGILRKRRKR